jgi:toxin ParE1/3/4
MSSFTLLLSPDAELDIDQAVQYYDSVSKGLGLEFINVIDKYFTQILQVPTASVIKYDQVRVKPVKVFPFTIHYIISDPQIIVLRVFNTYQKT